MKRYGIILAVAWFGFMANISFAAPTHQLVKELHRISTHQGMVVSGNYLYVSDMNAKYEHQVTIYDIATNQQQDVIAISHSITGLYAHGNSVVALGRRSKPHWSSHLTQITPNNGRFTTQATNLGDQIIAESAVSNGRELFFNEKGTRAIYRAFPGSRNLKKIPFEISGPGINMRVAGSKLYVVELRDLFNPGDESLVAIDMATNRGKRIATHERFLGLNNISIVGNDIIGVEAAVNRAVFIDLKTEKTIGRIKLPDGAYGIAKLHQCAVVVSDESKQLSFIRREGQDLIPVATWDLTVAGDRLKQPRTLAVDEANQQIFVRSNYPCSSCSVSQSSVFSFRDQDGIFAACQ